MRVNRARLSVAVGALWLFAALYWLLHPLNWVFVGIRGVPSWLAVRTVAYVEWVLLLGWIVPLALGIRALIKLRSRHSAL